MGNFNLKVYLDLLPGVKVRDIEGNNGRSRRCVCIPIDSAAGTVVDSFEKFDFKLGGQTSVPLKHIELRLTVYESANQEFSSHYLKCDISKERFEKMSEEQQRNRPIVGNMSPWTARGGKTAAVKTMTADEEEGW